MNIQLLPYWKNTTTAIGIILCLFICHVEGMAKTTPDDRMTPPVIQAIPNDTTINSICDLLPADTLMADDLEDGMIMAIPMDMPDSAMVDPCLGDTILRIWIATDSDGMIDRDTQRIFINPDTSPPLFTAPDVADYVVYCDSASLMSLFNQWKTQAALTLNSNIGNATDCSGVNLTPGSFGLTIPDDIDSRCDTLTAIFNFEDVCGNMGTYEFTSQFIIIDTIAPILQNLLPDTVAVTCDSLDIYLMDNPASTLTVDDCQPGLIPMYSEDTLLITTPCSDREFDLKREWIVVDSCGNADTAVQILQVRDEQAPFFTIPSDITISCDEDYVDLSITGDVTDTLDQCGGDILLTFSDFVVDIPDDCAASFRVFRSWTARDACSNQRSGQQIITVMDDEGPSFVLPQDTTVNCGEEENLMITGVPTMLMDNCDMDLAPEIAFEDIIPLSCENNYIIQRYWSVTDDCGNETIEIQEITVIDTIAPAFSVMAQNVVLTCIEGLDVNTVYTNWINQNGGAFANDICTPTDSLEWFALIAGTLTTPTMPDIFCPAPSDTILMQEVEFRVMDDCGNENVSNAYFIVIDNTAPELEACLSDTIISTSFGQCSSNFTLPPPAIKEECASGILTENISISENITADFQPGQEGSTPVDPVILNFQVANNLPINASSDAVLSLNLINADAEGATEYFNVYGEDGTLLGRTGRGGVQCGNADTMLTIPQLFIDQWAVDGNITIRLEPNIPTTQPGSFAINPICLPQSSVDANLSFPIRDFVSLSYAYKVNNGTPVSVAPIQPVTVTLSLGENTITYYIADCAGNTDSCSYMVTVQDLEPPILDCPADIAVPLETGSCSAMVTLPLPNGVTDNCALAEGYSETMPIDTGQAYLTFDYDPNLTDYLANEQTYTFSNVAANAFGTVTITLDLQGDFNSTGAFLNVIGDSGLNIGNTNIGVASCNTPGQATFTIPADTFNVWAVDGMVSFTLSPNPIPVPPGLPGDGINPCAPDVVDADGEVDSVTYVFLTLSYQEVTPFFYAEGATDIPYSQMVPPAITPTFEFNVGTTDVSYVTADDFGNLDTCTFVVDVVDDEPPVALCQPTIVEINPSGLDVDTVSVLEFDAGSFDNCLIDTMYLEPNIFTCEQAGTTVMATLTVIDLVGNTSICTKPIRIEAEAPEPTYSSGICGGDTLYLFANPPFAEGDIYTYRWTKDGNLVSTDENPIIPDVDSNDEGIYEVEIEGLTGCTAVEVVDVTITDLPLTPSIITDLNICNDTTIVLEASTPIPNATYMWYEGFPPSGTLIGTTSIPILTLPGPHQQGEERYYLEIEANGCLSPPSSTVAITITNRPVAVVNDENITLCEGEPIQLGTVVSGVEYDWTGPGFTSDAAYPPVFDAELSSEGIYTLVVTKNGCSSEPDITIVNVIPKPPTPILAVESGPVCEGETITLKTLPSGASTYHFTGPGLVPFNEVINELILDNATDEYEGEWWVVTTKFGCTSDTSNIVNVVVNDVPNAMVSADPMEVCERETLNLFASPTLLGATYEWEVPGDDNFIIQNPSISNVSTSDQGTYRMTITTAEGCVDTASVLVEVLESPSIIAVSNDAPTCLYGPTNVTLNATVFPADVSGDYVYKWTGGMNNFESDDPMAVIPNATTADNGTYKLVVCNAQGCSSLEETTMVSMKDAPDKPATPVLAAETQPPFCVGDVITVEIPPYSGNGVSYTWDAPGGGDTNTSESFSVFNALVDDSGSYTVYVTVDGCDSETSNELDIIVNPIPMAEALSNSPICEGDTLELYANNIAGADYEWDGPDPISSSLENPMILNADPFVHAGVYELEVTVNGCTSQPAPVEVVIYEAPNTPEVDNGGPICIDAPGAVLPLSIVNNSATPQATYVWYLDGVDVVDSTESLNLLLSDFTDFSDGIFDFYATAITTDGCVSDPSVSTSVQLNTIPDETAETIEDTSLCVGDEVQLSATAVNQSTGEWTLISGPSEGVIITTPTEVLSEVSGTLANNTYGFLWSLSNGACVNFSQDTLSISINEAEQAYAGVDTLLCDGDPVILNATLPISGTGSWSQTEVQESFLVNIDNTDNPGTSISGVGVRPGNTYVFTWTVNSECGSDEDKVFITISDNDPNAGVDQIACNDDGETQLIALTPAEGSAGQWSSLENNLIFSNRDSAETMVANLSIGDNIVLWTLDEGFCGASSVDTVIINYQNNPVAFDDEKTVEFAVETLVNVLLNDETPPNSYINIVSGPANGTATIIGDSTIAYLPKPSFIGTDILIYEVCSDGCECDEARLSFLVGEDAECEAPNIITPNEDGVNDTFTVPCLVSLDDFPNSQVFIFNRWGDEVYRSPVPYLNNWDGTFNGEELPADTYFYVVDFGNGEEPLSGYLLIQR